MVKDQASQHGLRHKLNLCIGFFMCLVLTFLVLPLTFNAFAEDGDFSTHDASQSQVPDSGWVLDGDGTLTIYGNGVISSVNKEYANQYSGNAAKVKALIIDEGITGISFDNEKDKGIFCGLKNLKTVKFPVSLKDIGNNSFTNCNELESIELGGAETIGEGCFKGCGKLSSINIGRSNVRSIGNYAFEWCSSLDIDSFPPSLEIVGDYAFHFCESLSSLNLSTTSVKSIGDASFKDCKNLQNVNLPFNLERIGNASFRGCDKLASINLDSTSIKSIGAQAISSCDALICIELPATLESIDEDAFSGCSQLKNVIINKVTTINMDAFSACLALEDIEFKCSIPEEIKGTPLYNITVIYPANDSSWTFESRRKILYGGNHMNMRMDDGSLTKAPFIPYDPNKKIVLGDTFKAIYNGSSSILSSISFDVPSTMVVDASFELSTKDWNGSFGITLVDAYEEKIAYYNFSLNDPAAPYLHEPQIESIKLDAGSYHFLIVCLKKKYAMDTILKIGLKSQDYAIDSPSHGTGEDIDNEIEYSIQDYSESNVRVTPNFGGLNLKSGDVATIQILPVDIPSDISSRMINNSLGAYEVNLYVTNSDGTDTKQIHDGFGTLEISFPADGHEGKTVIIHHQHHGKTLPSTGDYLTTAHNVVVNGEVAKLEVQDLSTFVVEASSSSNSSDNGNGNNDDVDQISNGYSNKDSVGNQATLRSDSDNSGEKGLAASLARSGDSLTLGLNIVLVVFSCIVTLMSLYFRKRGVERD